MTGCGQAHRSVSPESAFSMARRLYPWKSKYTNHSVIKRRNADVRAARCWKRTDCGQRLTVAPPQHTQRLTVTLRCRKLQTSSGLNPGQLHLEILLLIPRGHPRPFARFGTVYCGYIIRENGHKSNACVVLLTSIGRFVKEKKKQFEWTCANRPKCRHGCRPYIINHKRCLE